VRFIGVFSFFSRHCRHFEVISVISKSFLSWRIGIRAFWDPFLALFIVFFVIVGFVSGSFYRRFIERLFLLAFFFFFGGVHFRESFRFNKCKMFRRHFLRSSFFRYFAGLLADYLGLLSARFLFVC
jgi:hypothetical protein